MIDILIVDDDQSKIDAIRRLVGDILTADEARVTAVGNAYEAGTELRSHAFDLMILDINIPMRAAQPPRPEGGVQILRAINTRSEYSKPVHIVGLTEYPDLAARYGNEFDNEMWFIIQYSRNSTEWELLLGRKIIHIVESQRTVTVKEFGVDIAILTAMYRDELEAVLAIDASWERHFVPGDDTVYHKGRFSLNSKDLSVVAAGAENMGLPAATALAMKLIYTFSPKYVAIVGVAAGCVGKVGDILIADQVWDYGSGKLIESPGEDLEFRPSPTPILIEPSLKSKLSLFTLDSRPCRSIFANWEGTDGIEVPTTHIGPIASGALVVESPSLVERIRSQTRKLIGIEMECYGVFVAAREAKEPRPQVVAMKAIMDFANPAKNDKHKKFAAYASARYFHAFALEWL